LQHLGPCGSWARRGQTCSPPAPPASGALWGPLHGGANVEVVEMLERIHQGGLKAEDVVRAAKDKTNPFRLFGFGHRVYRNYDPRQGSSRKSATKSSPKINGKTRCWILPANWKGSPSPISTSSTTISIRTWTFTGGILLRAMGIPTNMFTVLFAIGRLPRLDRPMERTARRPQHEDSAAPANLHRPDGKRNYVPDGETVGVFAYTGRTRGMTGESFQLRTGRERPRRSCA